MGLNAYYRAGIPGLYVPMTVMVDYHGHRLVAMANLPIDGKKTLKYGSNGECLVFSKKMYRFKISDGGEDIRNENEVIAHLMKQAAEILNIKGSFYFFIAFVLFFLKV